MRAVLKLPHAWHLSPSTWKGVLLTWPQSLQSAWRVRARARVWMCVCVRVRVCLCACVHTRVCAWVCARVCEHAGARARACAYVARAVSVARVRVRIQSCARQRLRVRRAGCARGNPHTRTHQPTNANTHSHTHAHARTRACPHARPHLHHDAGVLVGHGRGVHLGAEVRPHARHVQRRLGAQRALVDLLPLELLEAALVDGVAAAHHLNGLHATRREGGRARVCVCESVNVCVCARVCMRVCMCERQRMHG